MQHLNKENGFWIIIVIYNLLHCNSNVCNLSSKHKTVHHCLNKYFIVTQFLISLLLFQNCNKQVDIVVHNHSRVGHLRCCGVYTIFQEEEKMSKGNSTSHSAWMIGSLKEKPSQIVINFFCQSSCNEAVHSSVNGLLDKFNLL